MRRNILKLLTLFPVLLEAKTMASAFFSVSLSAERNSLGEIFVKATYKNISGSDLYLYFRAPNITVWDPRNNKLKYIGPLVKRGELTLKDYEIIASKHTAIRTREVSKLYDFAAHGHGLFTFSTPGGYYDPVQDEYHESAEIRTRLDL